MIVETVSASVRRVVADRRAVDRHRAGCVPQSAAFLTSDVVLNRAADDVRRTCSRNMQTAAVDRRCVSIFKRCTAECHISHRHGTIVILDTAACSRHGVARDRRCIDRDCPADSHHTAAVTQVRRRLVAADRRVVDVQRPADVEHTAAALIVETVSASVRRVVADRRAVDRHRAGCVPQSAAFLTSDVVLSRAADDVRRTCSRNVQTAAVDSGTVAVCSQHSAERHVRQNHRRSVVLDTAAGPVRAVAADRSAADVQSCSAGNQNPAAVSRARRVSSVATDGRVGDCVVRSTFNQNPAAAVACHRRRRRVVTDRSVGDRQSAAHIEDTTAALDRSIAVGGVAVNQCAAHSSGLNRQRAGPGVPQPAAFLGSHVTLNPSTIEDCCAGSADVQTSAVDSGIVAIRCHCSTECD